MIYKKIRRDGVLYCLCHEGLRHLHNDLASYPRQDESTRVNVHIREQGSNDISLPNPKLSGTEPL